jgi:hypothetical protein
MRYPSDGIRFTLRLDPDLRELLAAEARQQMRCLNSEIVMRLKRSLQHRRGRAARAVVGGHKQLEAEAATKTATTP